MRATFIIGIITSLGFIAWTILAVASKGKISETEFLPVVISFNILCYVSSLALIILNPSPPKDE